MGTQLTTLTLEYDTLKMKIYSIFEIFGLFGMVFGFETWPVDLDAEAKKLGVAIDCDKCSSGELYTPHGGIGTYRCDELDFCVTCSYPPSAPSNWTSSQCEWVNQCRTGKCNKYDMVFSTCVHMNHCLKCPNWYESMKAKGF